MHATPAPRRALLLVALLLGLTLPLFSTVPAHAEVTQGIAGAVTGPDGAARSASIAVVPVDPDVELGGGIEYFWCDHLCEWWGTDAGGQFTIALPPGAYWVYLNATPRSDETLAPEWWQDSPSRQASTKVLVTEGALTTINPVLDHAASIAGTIPDTANGVAQNALVEAWIADDTFPGGYFRVGAGWTDGAGHYTIRGLAAAPYLIRARYLGAEKEGWFPDDTSAAAATPVPALTPGATVPGIDFSLSPFSKIRGTITSHATGPLAGADVTVYQREPSGWHPRANGATAADGSYELPAESGTYRIHVRAADHLDASLGGGSFAQSPTLAHSQAQDTEGADVILTPARAIPLTAARATGNQRVGQTLTAVNGSWYPSGLTFTYQWTSNGWPVPGATKSTYAVRPADAGRHLGLTVTAAKAGVPTGTTSWRSDTIRRGRFQVLSGASISGILRVGRALRAIAPTVNPTANVRYQWLRSWEPIRGATGRTYTLRQADRGNWISVRIVLQRPGFFPVLREPTRRPYVQ